MSIFNTQKKPARSKRPLGIDERRTPQHEQGTTMPVFWGTQRLGVTMLTEPFNRQVKPIRGQKKAGKAPGDNYAGLAFAISHGALQTIYQIWIDGDLWWDGELERDILSLEDSAEITVEDFGSGTIYWGTEAQPIDPTLDALGIGHPAYRGIAYFVFPNAFLGSSRDTVPTIEVVARRLGAFPSGSPFDAADDYNANPMTAVVEVLTNPRFGLGCSEDQIDLDGIAVVAGALNDEGFTISPVLDSQMTVRQFFAEIAEYFDGYFRIDRAGKVTWGLLRNTGGSGIILNESDMISEPVLKVGSWQDTSSAAQVVYTNQERYWMPEVVVGVDSANAMIRGQSRQPVYERRWLTDPAVATRLANALAQRNGRPWNTATLTVRASRAAALKPGYVCAISYGQLGLNAELIRVLSVEEPDPGQRAVKVEVTFDVGVLNGTYTTPTAYVPPPAPVLVPVEATYQDLWELPSVLGGSNKFPVVALLCAQPTLVTESFYGHFLLGTGAYDRLVPDSTTAFAIRAKIITAIGTTGNIDIEILGADKDLGRFSAEDFSSGRIAVWCGAEVARAISTTLLGPQQYRILPERGAFGTTATAQAVDDPVWLVQTERLYTRLIETDTALSVTFKIQPAIRRVAVDLAVCDALTIVVDPDHVGPFPPTNLEALGSSTPTWVGTDDIPITWIPTEDLGPVAVILEFWEPSGPTLVASVSLPYGTVDYTWPYATAVAALGGTPITFEIHAKHRSGTNIGGATVITVTR